MSKSFCYTKREEFLNALTHGIGALLSMIASFFLIIHAFEKGSAIQVICLTIYAITMFCLFSASTLVHSFPEGKLKDLFEALDHAAIYLFIAGTYTPFLFIVIKGSIGSKLFYTIWSIAVAGVVFKIFFTKKFVYFSTFLYIVMGWLMVLAWDPLINSLADDGIRLLVAGGVFYTFGTIFYLWRAFPFHHAVWHLFVLAGTAFHFFTIFLYVLPLL